MAILFLTDDLMLGSQVSQTAKQVGGVLQIVSNTQALLEDCQDAGVTRVILDLNHSQVQVMDLVPTLRQTCAPQTTILAIAPHVHTAKLNAAREAGCDQVLSRGQFQSSMTELVRSGL